MSETNDPFEWAGGKGAFKKYLMERSRSPNDLPDAKSRAVMACLVIPEPIQKWMAESGAVEPLVASIAETISAAETFKDAEITSLRSQLDEARKGCLDGVTGTSIDPERPSCLLVHFDHDVTEDDRERIRSAHNSVVTLRAQLEEARAKAIEECAQVAENFAEVTARIDGGIKSTTAAGMWNIAAAIRALIAGSTK